MPDNVFRCLCGDGDAPPILLGSFKGPGAAKIEIQIQPSRRYPLEMPMVTAKPPASPQSWLLGDRINWKRLGGTEASRMWRDLPAAPNPLQAFTLRIRELLTSVDVVPAEVNTTSHD
jgi:hypothetical protein